MAAARSAAAQESESAPDHLARFATEMGATRLASEWIPLTGGALVFRLSRAIEIGGAARIALTEPTLSRGGSNLRLHFGYAGLIVSGSPAGGAWAPLRLGLLVGAGNADIEEPGLGTTLDSDNGFVLEPSLSLARTLLPVLSVAGILSWRYATGFDAVGGRLASHDLRGLTVAMGFAIGPF